jgi:hypothetical protein
MPRKQDVIPKKQKPTNAAGFATDFPKIYPGYYVTAMWVSDQS